MTQRQDRPKPRDSALQRDAEAALSDVLLDQVSGGTDTTPSPPVSNTLKTKHDTVKNSISNIR